MNFTVITLRAAERDFNGMLEHIAARSRAGVCIAIEWACMASPRWWIPVPR